MRLAPLDMGPCSSDAARETLSKWKPAAAFKGSEEPDAAMTGLWLYFSCWEEAHELANNCTSAEGYLWHAIVHRQEGDSGNSAYWFRKAGRHQVHSQLSHEAARILTRYPRAEFRAGRWDPYSFVSFCERARQQPGSQQEQAAREIQRAEWQLLFDYCARPAE